MDSLEAIRQTFFEECDEQLVELETGLLAMNDGTGDRETVNAVFRAVHSVKGGAGAFELGTLVRFAHLFETVLDRVRAGDLEASADVIKILLRAADVLADLVIAAKAGDEAHSDSAGVAENELNALVQTGATPPSTAPADETKDHPTGAGDQSQWTSPGNDGHGFTPVAIDFSGFMDTPEPVGAASRNVTICFRPFADLYTRGNETVLLLRELERLGDIVVTCNMAELPLLDVLDANGSCLSWRIELRTEADESEIRAVFEFVEQDCDLEIHSAGILAPAASTISPNSEFAPEQTDTAANTPAISPYTAAAVIAQPTNQLKAGVLTEQSSVEPERHIPPSTESGAQVSTIRVDLDKVDRLINLVGELVIRRAMLSQRIGEAGINASSEVAVALDELEQLTREIQESIMAIRAQPVKPLFQRMSRIVREAAAATGKSVRLRIDGETTEVDKTVIERLADPLTHMIRNAVDHGLEAPQTRQAEGKPEEGVVHLAASHRSGRVVIEVSDDGAGIDRPKVHAAAVRKGLIAADVPLTDAEIDNLLFLPGFSTVSNVSNLSGRGVGMDVVKRSIQALGGRITTASKPGAGTTFSMSLPLTLAILDGMVVRLAGRTVIIPLTSIVETLKPRPSDIHPLGSSARVVAIRGSFVPLIDVASELGFRTGSPQFADEVVILVEIEGGTRRALLIDRIVDQRQVVIKSLETNYGLIDGIAAATILGDGRVALILDVDAIVKRARIEQAVPGAEFATLF